MNPDGYIDRNEAIPANQDFVGLRKQAIEHIQTLCGHLWTDHNLHDPGITSIEALIVALVDLSYRTTLPLRDLMAKEDGEIDLPTVSGFFPPEEMLPSGPVTVFDLRRLLLKIKGIRNAWCAPVIDGPGEVPLYFDHETNSLAYLGDPSTDRYEAVYLSGLYRVLLELEIDDELGSLNEFRVRERVLDHAAMQGAMVEITAESESIQTLAEEHVGDFRSVQQLTTVSLQSDGSFLTSVTIEVEAGTVDLGTIRVRILESSDDITQNQVRAWLLSDAAPLAKLWKKYQRIFQTVSKARCAMAANRGLTEDFIDVGPVATATLGICADIDVDPSADLEAIKAEVIQRIDQYLNPAVVFSSLSELLASGESIDQILSGPYVDWALTCGDEDEPVFEQVGFVDADSLAASELKQTVYTSDIIQVLAGIEGIRAVRNVALRKPAAGGGNEQTDRWCLLVKPYHQPRLDPNESRFRFYKEGVPYRIRTEEFELSLAQLRSLARSQRLMVGKDRIEQEKGKFRDPAAFFSVQDDFPQVYGIGTAGLPPTASEQRLALAKQFKGYLAVFDQLLADYLAQLAHTRDLLSLRDDLDRTFFRGSLESVPGVRKSFAEEFFVEPGRMLDTDRRDELAEDDVRFAARRNQALDHIIARFAESFVDYAFLTYSLDGDSLFSDRLLIQKRITFAREYPNISRRRSLGSNYTLLVWDTDNVSGLEHRVSRLLGIERFDRHNLFCEALLEKFFSHRKQGNKFRLEIKTGTQKVLFSSEKLFDSEAELNQTATRYYDRMNEASSYEVEKVGDDSWTYSILSPKRDERLRNGKRYATQQEAVEAAHGILLRHNELLSGPADENEGKKICQEEGFHLIEHILLRPKAKNDPLMQPCMADLGHPCGDQDPYSHRISVLCPAWPHRFRSLEFRRFFERTLRTETPAHIHARICWISNQAMARLDRLYRDWLNAVNRSLASERTRRRRLIEFLETVESVYPPAELHDCEDDTDITVPVRLDETKLGLF